MTKEEYADVRDVFAGALRELEEALQVFYDTAYDFGWDDQEETVGEVLEENGAWLEPLDFFDLVEGRAALERLVGRAHARAAR